MFEMVMLKLKINLKLSKNYYHMKNWKYGHWLMEYLIHHLVDFVRNQVVYLKKKDYDVILTSKGCL